MNEIIQLLDKYGPTLAVLIISYYRDQILRAEHKKAVVELNAKLSENKNVVEKENSGLSSDAIIDKYTNS